MLKDQFQLFCLVKAVRVAPELSTNEKLSTFWIIQQDVGYSPEGTVRVPPLTAYFSMNDLLSLLVLKILG